MVELMTESSWPNMLDSHYPPTTAHTHITHTHTRTQRLTVANDYRATICPSFYSLPINPPQQPCLPFWSSSLPNLPSSVSSSLFLPLLFSINRLLSVSQLPFSNISPLHSFLSHLSAIQHTLSFLVCFFFIIFFASANTFFNFFFFTFSSFFLPSNDFMFTGTVNRLTSYNNTSPGNYSCTVNAVLLDG